MTKPRLLAVSVVALVGVAFAAGCGNERVSVGANDVAVVDNCVISKEQFNNILDQAKVSYKTNKQPFPEPGTEQYTALRKQAMQFLVQRCEFNQAADELGLEITDEDVEKQLATIKTQYFGKDGKCDAACEKKYQAQIAKQELTERQVRDDVRASVVQNKLYTKVTDGVTVSDEELEEYYKKNKQQYVLPESRDVRHILVKKKALADQLYQQVTSGGDFAALAKKHSEDPGSKTSGGKLTVSKGRQVPEFDKSAFSLAVDEISKPIKTQYGWHIIQALTKIKKASTTPLSEVKPQIRQQLLQQEKQEEMKKWVADTSSDFENKTAYQVGYAPPADTTTGATPTAP